MEIQDQNINDDIRSLGMKQLFCSNDEYNDFIETNYASIRSLLAKEGIDFHYEPTAIHKGLPRQLQKQLSDFVDEAKLRNFDDESIKKFVENALKKYIKLRVIVTKNYDIVLEDNKGKRIIVDMNSLPKTLYIFFMKHNRSFDKFELSRYIPELVYIYIKVRTDVKRDPFTVIDNLVTKQLGNNVFKIREAFQKAVDEKGQETQFTIEYDKEPKLYMIELPDKNRLLECRDISNKTLPLLPDNCINSIEKTKEIFDKEGIQY